MKTYVTRDIFIDTFQSSHDYNKFSMNALNALYEYYEMLEDSCGEEMNFDYIGIACDWNQYDSLEEAYNDHYGDDSDLPEHERRTEEDQHREYFEEHTSLIEFTGGVLIMQF